MKCYACGYEKQVMMINDNKIIRFKSGPRKGQIKETIENRRDFFEDTPKFIEINIGKGDIDFTQVVVNDGDMWPSENESATIYACPECGTLKLKLYI
jgi:hypothetical protein